MPFEDIGVCSDDHTISGFPSTWGRGKEESECKREMEILLNNCQWAKHNMALALNRTHNSRSLYLLSSSVMEFQQAQHKNCIPAASHLETQPLGWDMKQKCCLFVVRNDPQALVHLWITVSNSMSWPVSLDSTHMSHYEFTVEVLCSPHTHCGLHIALFLTVGFFQSSVTSLQTFPPFPPLSGPWFCCPLHSFCIPAHHVSSSVLPALSDSINWCSKLSLESRNCSTVLLQYYLQRSIPQMSKTPHFAEPIIISAALNCPAACPLTGALSLTRHSLAQQAVTWL